ncbi:MAG: hypothetical protein JSS09_06340 [Verrucomicrobia bacterium]|nr:hypothetical protein [Verrucomicrobiota bacterium]
MNVSFVTARPDSRQSGDWFSGVYSMSCTHGDLVMKAKVIFYKTFASEKEATLDAMRVSREEGVPFVPFDKGMVSIVPSQRDFAVIKTDPCKKGMGLSSFRLVGSHVYSNHAVTQAQEVAKTEALVCLIPRLYD